MTEKCVSNIVACSEGTQKAPPPPSLFQSGGLDRISGRIVLEWSCTLGDYGMGGPGFFGLKLSALEPFPQEWLVLTLWSACTWLMLDGDWVDAHPRYHDRQLPLFINYGDAGSKRDLVSAVLVGAEIVEAEFNSDSSLLTLVATDGGRHRLEIPVQTSLLPPLPGGDQPRVWHKEEDQRLAWVVRQGRLYL